MSHHKNSHTIEGALKILREGNARYAESKALHPHQDEASRHKLAAEGQAPLAAVLACSDSRVAVEAIFDLGLGDLFVVRSAGQVLGPDQLGSLEYAVAHLGVPLIFVLAHSKCGAITAAVAGARETGHLASLLEKIAPLAKMVENEPEERKVPLAIDKSVAYGIEAMKAQSGTISEAEKAGKIKICGGVYDLHSGLVKFM